jgi:hypothetical protein
MRAIISQRDFQQMEHITLDGLRSKQLSGFLAACCLDQPADLFYQRLFSKRVRTERVKGHTLPYSVSATERKAQETHKDVVKCPE